MTDLESAFASARTTRPFSHDGFIGALADRLGGAARVETVFGVPVERDGVTVIPVARVSLAGGGGGGAAQPAGEGKPQAGEGGGGGGRITAKPAGYIRIRGGDADFVRIGDPAALVPLVLAAGAVTWLLLRALKGFLK